MRTNHPSQNLLFALSIFYYFSAIAVDLVSGFRPRDPNFLIYAGPEPPKTSIEPKTKGVIFSVANPIVVGPSPTNHYFKHGEKPTPWKTGPKEKRSPLPMIAFDGDIYYDAAASTPQAQRVKQESAPSPSPSPSVSPVTVPVTEPVIRTVEPPTLMAPTLTTVPFYDPRHQRHLHNHHHHHHVRSHQLELEPVPEPEPEPEPELQKHHVDKENYRYYPGYRHGNGKQGENFVNEDRYSMIDPYLHPRSESQKQSNYYEGNSNESYENDNNYYKEGSENLNGNDNYNDTNTDNANISNEQDQEVEIVEHHYFKQPMKIVVEDGYKDNGSDVGDNDVGMSINSLKYENPRPTSRVPVPVRVRVADPTTAQTLTMSSSTALPRRARHPLKYTRNLPFY